MALPPASPGIGAASVLPRNRDSRVAESCDNTSAWGDRSSPGTLFYPYGKTYSLNFLPKALLVVSDTPPLR